MGDDTAREFRVRALAGTAIGSLAGNRDKQILEIIGGKR
jgi:hypothetical protein